MAVASASVSGRGTRPAFGCRLQVGLSEPALQGACLGQGVLGQQVLQVAAQIASAPGGMVAAQLQRLGPHGVWGWRLGLAVLGQQRGIGGGRELLQEVADGADGDTHSGSDGGRGEAALRVAMDGLADRQGGWSRHGADS
jgi:hypothetical protein